MMKLFEALREHGIESPRGSIDNGRMHRWGYNNRFWARRFNGGYVFGDFVENLSAYVFDKDDYSKSEQRALRVSMEQSRKEAEEEQARINEEASVRANKIWSQSSFLSYHPYLGNKKVLSHGLKENNGEIIIPVYDENGKLWSLQRIFQCADENGKQKFFKQFLSGSKSKGCYVRFI